MKVLLLLCIVALLGTVYSSILTKIPDFKLSPCYQRIIPGKCKGYAERFAYYTNEKKCKMFVYSGCEGNQNNFKSLRECENACLI